jgi:hypothetical protein
MNTHHTSLDGPDPRTQLRSESSNRRLSVELATGGVFWVPERRDVRVRGQFTMGVGTNAEVTLEGGLVEDPRVRRTSNGAALSGAAEDWVASFIPITVHGQLDTGETVTLLNANNHGSDGEFFGFPRYRAHTVMFGSHIPSVDQLVAAVRFRAGHPYWLAHLQDGDTYRHDDGSTLTVEGADDGNWLVYTPPDPMRLRRLEITAVSGSLVLMELALDQTVVTRDTQVRIDADGPWIAVHGGGFSAPASGFSPDSLLPCDELTVERFAKWIAFNAGLDGLAWAVANPTDQALQAQVLLATSFIEGIHRRLPYEQSKFPGVPKASLKAILDAAREAAGTEAEREGIDRHDAINSLQFLTDVSFRTRAKEIVNEVCSVLPEITESVTDMPGRMTKSRNDLAHHLLQKEEKEPLEIRYLRWLVVVTATPWLLRGLLLLRAGIAPDVLHSGYMSSNRFDNDRANLGQFVRELGWELPESMEEGLSASNG